jgi:hypothetical protein
MPKRQLTGDEKAEVLRRHGRTCFIDGEPIGEDETAEFHHIQAFSEGGPTTIDNIAPVCRRHHLTIGTMSLQEYRDKLSLDKFFEDGEPKYLDDLIRYRIGRSGRKAKMTNSGNQIGLFFDDGPRNYPLDKCPATGWHYFYATLPVEYLCNDTSLQPRALREASLWSLYRHFSHNTQLAPSVCRVDGSGEILLFDGQHKAAAQVWARRKAVECKVYLDPDPRTLKETNLEAHGAFRQMSFYSHELMLKYADVFGEDWGEYMASEGAKSEAGFVEFLVGVKKKTRAQARKEVALFIYKQIVDDPGNKMSAYLSEKHRGQRQPLSFYRLQKTFFQHMLVTPPVKDEFESDSDFRKQEQQNLVRLMNMVAEEGLENRWHPDLADAAHLRAERLFSAGAVRAWVVLLKDTINQHLRHYTDGDRIRFLYQPVSDEDFGYIRRFVRRLFSHKIWDDPDPSGSITARLAKDDVVTAKALFDENYLSVPWVLNSP